MRSIKWSFRGVDGAPTWEGEEGLGASAVRNPPLYVSDQTAGEVESWLLAHGEEEAAAELAAARAAARTLMSALGRPDLMPLPGDWATTRRASK